MKQVLVVRKDLHMRKGKIAAQCSHASTLVILNQLKKYSLFGKICFLIGILFMKDPLYKWIYEEPFTKVVTYVESEASLLNLYKRACEAGILCSLIQDSGKTEFGGVPTYTCIAVGPDTVKNIDFITGGLRLL